MTAVHRALVGALLVAATSACGARSGLQDIAPDAALDVTSDVATDAPLRDVTIDTPRDLPVDLTTDTPRDLAPEIDARVEVACPAPVLSTQGSTATLTARATSSASLPLTFRWSVERAPADSSSAPSPANAATTRLTFDTSGEWLLRFTASDPLGHSASCVARATATPAIDLLCPNDQSNYQGATVALVATARSRLALPVTLSWTTEARPAASMSAPAPADGAAARLALDALGDWRLRLTARDSAGHTAACVTRVHADPDVIVTCPPDRTARPFTSTTLSATARSRLGLPLTYQWDFVERPITSTAPIAMPTSLSTAFGFDVAGLWAWRFTARNGRGGEASCTTRAFVASDEAVRVELVWNLDRSCTTCNASGGGLDLDLHLTDASRSDGHWNGLAPDNSDCYWENCKCFPSGSICDRGVLDWPPAGASNDPQLDVDHMTDRPGPENINVLTASVGARFDVGVHFFGDNTTPIGTQRTAAVVRVYCAGAVIFESEPVTLDPVRTTSVTGADVEGNPLWRVGQVAIEPTGCTFTRCGTAGDVAGCIRPARAW